MIVVSVEQTFPQCPKALVRSDQWKRGSLGRPQGVPTLGDFAAARYPETDSAAFDAAYAQRIPNELYLIAHLSYSASLLLRRRSPRQRCLTNITLEIKEDVLVGLVA